MTISSEGTYSADIEFVDTTGTIFPENATCSDLITAKALGTTDTSGVTAEKITEDNGNGCHITIAKVPIKNASDTASGAIVVRDGDHDVFTLPALTGESVGSDALQGTTMVTPSAQATPSASSAATGTPSPHAQTTPPTGSSAPGASSTDTPFTFNGLIDTKVSVTFPGAVTKAGGGQVSGTTVTWTDPDVLAQGVSASGLADKDAGVPLWRRTSVVVGITGLSVAVALILAILIMKRGRSRRGNG